jgi:hypothetical protein
VPIVLKSGSLNLLETSGLVKACNGIAFPLKFTTYGTSFCGLEAEYDSYRIIRGTNMYAGKQKGKIKLPLLCQAYVIIKTIKT